MKTVKMLFLALALIAPAAQGADLSPTFEKKMVAMCDSRIRSHLVAPTAAELIPGSNGVKAWDGVPGKYVYHACYQSRSKGGGFGVVFGVCQFMADGTFILADAAADKSGALCEP